MVAAVAQSAWAEAELGVVVGSQCLALAHFYLFLKLSKKYYNRFFDF